MIEDRVYFKAGNLTMEGLFAPAPGKKGVVITHPHSLMGGNMRDHVVLALVTAFYQKGCSSLRFNFRGVGRSEGFFDDGVGEVDDLAAAVDFVSGQGIDDIYLAGYSFGALMVMKYLFRQTKTLYTVLVSPPIHEAVIPLERLMGTRGLMVCGENDPFCPLVDLKRAAESIGWDVGIVPGADHFYLGQGVQLIETIGRRLTL